MDAGSQQSQLDTKLRQYQALIEVAESIAVHRDLSSLLQDLAQRLQLVVKFDVVNVVLHDPEHNSMQMNVLESPSLPGAQFVAQLPVEESPSGWVRQTQQPLLITDLGAYQTRYPRMIADLKKHDIKTVYLLPLTSAGRRLGALGFGSLLESAWSEADQGLLQEVAKLVAVAVDSAINFETAHAAEVELKRRLDHLRLMLKITNEVVSQLDLWELLRVITSSIREAIASDTVGVGLFDYESGQLRTFANDVPPGHPLREKALQSRSKAIPPDWPSLRVNRSFWTSPISTDTRLN